MCRTELRIEGGEVPKAEGDARIRTCRHPFQLLWEVVGVGVVDVCASSLYRAHFISSFPYF